MTCIDLRERFGAKYRIGHDPARRPGESFDPWLLVIRCKNGEIYPFGGTTLAVDVEEGHRNIRKRLKGLPCCRVHQRGHDFACYLFDVEDFETVAQIV
jgi:hypothetical protein